MKLLVTGGAGFIGSNFVRNQVHSGSAWSEIYVLDSLTYAGNLANLEPLISAGSIRFIHGDITDLDLVDSVLRGIDSVVHFAAESHVDRSISDSSAFVKTNVLGTQNLLNFSLKHTVNRFVHVSTDEVYGSIESGSWDEQCSLKPNSPYAASKASSDLFALSFHRTYGMDVRVTRCSNNYGPRQYPEKIIPYFISLLRNNLQIPIYGDGLNSRDWLHVDDHCNAISLVLKHGQPGEVYNIGGGRELSNLELVEKLLEVLGKDKSLIKFVEDRKGHDRRYSIDDSRIRRDFGYQPNIDFEEGLKSTVAWYLSHPAWLDRSA